MPTKGSGTAEDWRVVERWDGGVSWMAYPDEDMQRASHAVAADGQVWVFDPLDAPGLDDLLAEYGEVAGVVPLLNRHTRDAATVANRHGVAVHVPRWMDGVADDVDAPVEFVRTELGSTGYGIHRLIDNPLWKEAVVYGEDTGVLAVPEAVGTADFFLSGDERLGVHPVLRLVPPKRLRRFDPERILVGHGEGVHRDAAAALERALDESRSGAPSLYAKTAKNLVLG